MFMFRILVCHFLLFSVSSILCQASPYNLLDSAKQGDENAVRKLLIQDSTMADTTDARGFTPLHWAGIRAHWYCFKHLLEANAPVNAVGGDGGTPLHWAAHHDNAEMIQLLLDKGADFSVANQWGRCALHVATRRGNLNVAALLLDSGADPNTPTREGWTPLHVASLAGQDDLIELLQSRGADTELKDSEGKKPADYKWQRPEAIELSQDAQAEYVGIFDLGGGYAFTIWQEDGGLSIQEFAPDRLYPIGKDQFYCQQEPWHVTFQRDNEGKITSVDVNFLRRMVTGQKRDHPLYVGSETCQSCHLGGDGGNQVMKWITGRHASAYWRLATDWAKMLATFRPWFKDMTDPLSDDRCLLCHVTTAQDPAALAKPEYSVSEGVGCETCHGPGSQYSNPEVMSDHARFLASGGEVPDEKTCTKCHRNPERFDYATWWPKISH